MTDFDPRALRNAFGTFLTGVTVVTTHDGIGQPIGFTANSFSSVSLDPPLVSVCLANTSGNFNTFSKTAGFAINILAEDQIELSNTFARPAEDRFAGVSWQAGPNGAPILAGVSAWFDCTVFKTVEAGDHLILIGRVEAFDHSIAPGLGYVRGAYVTPAAEARALSRRSGIVISALIEREGLILLQDDGSGGLTIPATKDLSNGADTALAQLIRECGVTAEPGFIYSVYQDKLRQQHISFLCQAEGGTPTKGVFTQITDSTLMDVADPAICTMLERFAQESRMGNFGVYYGDETSGRVKPLVRGN
ncbi:MAG: flavin reductase family protein [Ruegeria sp.]